MEAHGRWGAEAWWDSGGLEGVAVDAGALRSHSLQAHHFYAYQIHAAQVGRGD